jgi:hypothetical protein
MVYKSLIRRAREIIRDPARWTQATAARDDAQRAVSPRSDKARSFCVFGTLTKAADEIGLSDRWVADLFDVSLLSQLVRANDSQDHATLMSLREQLERETRDTEPPWGARGQSPNAVHVAALLWRTKPDVVHGRRACAEQRAHLPTPKFVLG